MSTQSSGTPYAIRPARAEDAPALLALIRQLGAYERRPEAVKTTEVNLRQWLLNGSFAQALLAQQGQQPVGYAIFHPVFHSFQGVPSLYLEDVFVVEAARGTGLGTELMRHAARYAVQQGYTGLEWSCLDWNEPSIGFYHHLGAHQKPATVSFSLSGSALDALIGN